jgi:hypothetical protein
MYFRNLAKIYLSLVRTDTINGGWLHWARVAHLIQVYRHILVKFNNVTKGWSISASIIIGADITHCKIGKPWRLRINLKGLVLLKLILLVFIGLGLLLVLELILSKRIAILRKDIPLVSLIWIVLIVIHLCTQLILEIINKIGTMNLFMNHLISN